MDLTPIIALVWGMLIWFIPAAILIALLKSLRVETHIGKLIVCFSAHLQLNEHINRRLHGVTLNTPVGCSRPMKSLYGMRSVIDWIFDRRRVSWINEFKNLKSGHFSHGQIGSTEWRLKYTYDAESELTLI